ncbi:SCO7613 C-terminal domain-containing membrane protein [Streptomyces sp. HMX87]|uniref:SCO7613 C-terminal domain-containing membrane protein n=1 Tax=Streptomyces sp. HMX87 TaxID=3390849 RepID=UPI003A8869E8
MTNLPPPAEELRLLDAELRQLDARRVFLLRRRAYLIHTLNAACAPRPAPHTGPAAPGWPTGGGTVAARPETTAPSVQNVLLVLGGVLLTIAAIAFTLVGWGHMGIAGRALVLGAVTTAALGVPVALLRRGLGSTAEAMAGLGIALTVLDAYALHEVVFTGADGLGYTAAASAVLAGAWAAYGAGVGALVPPPTTGAATQEDAARKDTANKAAARKGATPEAAARKGTTPKAAARKGVRLPLRLPLPLAAATAQLPLLLWALAAGAGPHTLTAVLLVTAAADTAVALRTALVPVRIIAIVGASGMGAWGVPAAGWLCWSAAGPGAAARGAVLLFLAAAIALTAAWFARRPGIAMGAALAGGLCLVAGAGGMLRALVPSVWTVPGCLACGIALLAVVRTRPPGPVRQGLVMASLTVQGLAVLWAVPLVAGTLLGPVAWAGRVWSGAPQDARAAAFTDVPWPPYAATVPLVLAVVAGVLAVAGRGAAWRPAAAVGALALGWATAFVFPAVLGLPYWAGLVAQGAVVVAALVSAEWTRRASAEAAGRSPLPLTAVLLALVTSVGLAFVSLASEPATIVVLVALTVLFGAAAFRPGLAPFAAPASLVYATALACALGASAGWQTAHTALPVLVVSAVAALVAARLGGSRSPATVPVEVTGAAAALLALTLAMADLPMLALVLSLGGVVAAGTALRPERRAAGGRMAAVLFLAGTWVRLVAWGVTAPEAYTLPVTVPALVVGSLRRRRDPAVASWTAYGAGLAATLVPSLLAAWGDPHWSRPLLLGTAALAVTLAGARHRLQAPLVLGGSVLALVALHELAPYIVQVVDALPRWVPPALAGLVLLALGATYEQRLRDARRVRELFGRFH